MSTSGKRRGASSPKVMIVKPGWGVLDTGCGGAVGGPRWHQEMQIECRKRNKQFVMIEKKGKYQFGTGLTYPSTVTWRYQVGINKRNEVFEIARIEVDIPGLFGPENMAQWNITVHFRSNMIETYDGRKMQMTYIDKGPPCINLMDFPDDDADFPNFLENLQANIRTGAGFFDPNDEEDPVTILVVSSTDDSSHDSMPGLNYR